MAVYGTGMSPTKYHMDRSEAEVHILFVGDRPLHKLPFGPKCHALFAILYSIHANLSDDMFFFVIVYLRPKTS